MTQATSDARTAPAPGTAPGSTPGSGAGRGPAGGSPGPGDPAEPVVSAAIAEISHIATLPEVTLRIIQLVEDPDSTAQDLNQVISNDPALGARILKVVNSAFYGLPGQIGSINRAIVLLGLNAVKNIAIAASLAKLFRGGKICPGFDARELWTHCVGVASATRLLSDKAGLRLPDEAFLAGLVHDLGIMVEVQARRAKFVEVIDALEANPEKTLRQAEAEILGANHEQFGSGLCKQWKFPVSFHYVTGFHHHPWDLQDNRSTLTELVYVADVLCAREGIGFTRGTEATEPDGGVLRKLDLTSDDFDAVAKALPDAMSEAQSIFTSSG